MKNPDFVKLAEAMNCKGLRVLTEEELPEVMREFLTCEEPVLLDAVCDAAQHVYPMVPAGTALDQMVYGTCLVE
jgi:acetolactate synthase-1/2/3 large subunit